MEASQTGAGAQVMDTNRTRLESLRELSKQSFGTFCEDVSGMFGVNMECNQEEVAAETVKGLKKRFKEPVAVSSVKAEGSLDGAFQLVFDRDGLFTLAGVIVMHPKEVILENRKLGSLEKARDLSEVLTEAGETLVASWDRTFRKGLDGHGRFVQTDTFIGDTWDKSKKKIGLAGDEELVFVPYEMTITPYPAFKCGVIFPKTILAGPPLSDTKQEVTAEEKTQDQKAVVEKADSKEPDAAQESDSEKSKPQGPPVEKAAAEKTPAEENTDEAVADKSEDGPVSKTIQEMAQSPAVLPGESTVSTPAQYPTLSDASAAILAKDIMQKNVLWGTPDDSIQQALTKMQQHDAEYMIIGIDGVLESIVSKSDLTGAISPYLRPTFAKWRRPLDDATLQIKLKWIISKPVHTIRLETPLATIMENMCRSGRSVLAVTDQQSKVQGLISAFDIFKTLLKSEQSISTEAEAPYQPASA
jgi:predicted transcriptional regulator